MGCTQVLHWLPSDIFLFVETHPFDLIVHHILVINHVVQDAFDFIFGHIIDGDWRGRWYQWGSVCNLGGVLVLSEEGDMKDRVYSQSSREI